MLRSKMKLMKLLPILLMLGLILSTTGCFENFSLNSVIDERETQEFEQADIGKIQILKVDPIIMQFIKSNVSDSMLTMEKVIQSNVNGLIEVGSDYLGYCKLNFESGTLQEDVSIKMDWNIDDGKFEVKFSPEGLNFNKPVLLEMFYNIAELKNIDEEKLKLFYFNEEKNIWELIGGVTDIAKKMFTVEITHFSRYALAHSE